MKTLIVCFLSIFVVGSFILMLGIMAAAAKKPPMNPEDEKEWEDHNV